MSDLAGETTPKHEKREKKSEIKHKERSLCARRLHDAHVVDALQPVRAPPVRVPAARHALLLRLQAVLLGALARAHQPRRARHVRAGAHLPLLRLPHTRAVAARQPRPAAPPRVRRALHAQRLARRALLRRAAEAVQTRLAAPPRVGRALHARRFARHALALVALAQAVQRRLAAPPRVVRALHSDRLAGHALLHRCAEAVEARFTTPPRIGAAHHAQRLSGHALLLGFAEAVQPSLAAPPRVGAALGSDLLTGHALLHAVLAQTVQGRRAVRVGAAYRADDSLIGGGGGCV
ncbi:hypothetical protein FGB62_89g122 [Gracilaria domingensis]|nr:hypothetical protein FGB62_89g122 [Gracilaria domingensis]